MTDNPTLVGWQNAFREIARVDKWEKRDEIVLIHYFIEGYTLNY